MMPFIDEVRRFYDGPLIVGGGISTGRAIRAVETLGADFSYIGTRFLAAPETLIYDEYRKKVIDCHMEELIASRAITGALGNWMRASVDAAGISVDDMQVDAKIDFSGDMHSGAKAWKSVWSAGQGVGQVTSSESISTIVDTLVFDYIATISSELQSRRFYNSTSGERV
jgi:nitronate monooxygenase